MFSDNVEEGEGGEPVSTPHYLPVAKMKEGYIFHKNEKSVAPSAYWFQPMCVVPRVSPVPLVVHSLQRTGGCRGSGWGRWLQQSDAHPRTDN